MLRYVFVIGLMVWIMEGVVAETPSFREQVEADWKLQEAERRPGRALEPALDAAGAVNGIKDGGYGFHTAQEDGPWWQVDLQTPRRIARIVVWNRTDGVAPRADTLHIQFSDDDSTWRTVYVHTGPTFYGFQNGPPLEMEFDEESARYVRLTLPDVTLLHLDEVEVFDSEGINMALHQPATQSSLSPWSTDSSRPEPVDLQGQAERLLEKARQLAAERAEQGIDVAPSREALDKAAVTLDRASDDEAAWAAYREVRWVLRELLLQDPLLDFDEILVTKRAPGIYNHMSDQYYGWWSRPGGGIYRLRDYQTDTPSLTSITDAFTEPGSFLRPTISYEGDTVLFAWARYYDGLANEPDKENKDNVPEDAFYNLFEMDLDGGSPRQLTRGKYDDFDGRYLPDDRIVFCSTRRGHFVQTGRSSAAATLETPDLPDMYVRCGGGPQRPVAVYTLHTMNRDGSDMIAISPFEMFEWEPSIAHDGTILYSRWDYIDRDNMPFMSLWSIHPDGANARLVYGNFTHAPHCTFEPMAVPDSRKIVFTGSGHHAQTMGSLVLLDPAAGTEFDEPITRLTPEVEFPEIEGWPRTYYASPWPLSERLYLVSWGVEETVMEGQVRPENGMGVYLFDAELGLLELLHRDPHISTMYPIPVQSRPRPPVIPNVSDPDAPKVGQFLLTDVYQGLESVERGTIQSLRIVGVPGKTQPVMNSPALGVTTDDPGKFVLGTVPVEADGSAHFKVPASVILFFQALDDRGEAVQTMRSATYAQPGQTVSCIGCHESRLDAPPSEQTLAAFREPSTITPGPEGSWPYRFDTLVQPVLDQNCLPCHDARHGEGDARAFPLDANRAYETLIHYGAPSLYTEVWERYREGRSIEGRGLSTLSAWLDQVREPGAHHDVALSADDKERLITWLDTYGQRLGHFSDAQEQDLIELKANSQHLGILDDGANAMDRATAKAD